MSERRICVIGAGPSGLSTLYHFAKLEEMPEIVCYEKQHTWMGQWNVSWKTGNSFVMSLISTNIYSSTTHVGYNRS